MARRNSTQTRAKSVSELSDSKWSFKRRFLTKPYIVKRWLHAAALEKINRNLLGLTLSDGQVYSKLKSAHYSKHRVAKAAEVKTMDPLRDLLFAEIKKLNQQYWEIPGRLYKTRLQYVSYGVGGRFDWHVDSPHHRLIDSKQSTDRVITAILMLSSRGEYSGGSFELQDFFGGRYKISLGPGELLLIPSIFPHRVQPITKGARRVLVLWTRGRPLQSWKKAIRHK